VGVGAELAARCSTRGHLEAALPKFFEKNRPH